MTEVKNTIRKTNVQIDPYNSARFRLTLLYFISMFVIITVFSVVIIIIQSNQFGRLRDFQEHKPTDVVIQFGGTTDESLMYQGGQIFIPVGQSGPLNVAEITTTAIDIERNFVKNIIITDIFLTISLILVSYLLAGVTLRPIKDALDQQKKFIADASHEFKTPLAVIKTEAEVLMRDKNAETSDYKEFVGSTIEEVNRMSELTSNLLYITKTDSVPSGVVIESTDIRKLTDKVIKKFETTAHENKVKIEKKLIGKSFLFETDKDKIEQLLSILVDNAIKYNRKDGSIVISLISSKNKQFKITVEDTGIGIPKESINQIFNRFYRVSQDRHMKGFGLGLAIAKQIVSDLGANIYVDSVVNKGTKISVILFE